MAKKVGTDECLEKTYNLDNWSDLLEFLTITRSFTDLKKALKDHIESIINKYEHLNYNKIVFLIDFNDPINDSNLTSLVKAISEDKENKILLIIHSRGGSVEPAYLISKFCMENSSKFSVAVPRKAKSAATLISLGASEIHMGSVSHLGPIDPQFGGLPALGLANAVEYLASLCKTYPEASDMFAKYLSNKLDLEFMGYFQRIPESAKHYAERLLAGKKLPNKKTASDIAHQLVYSYKDHSFVIDHTEAKELLGDCVKVNSVEYQLSNEIFEFLNDANSLLELIRKKTISLNGSLDDIFIYNIK